MTALWGAVGFLSRLPVGRDEQAWNAFRTTPAVFPVAGALVGVIVALPLIVPGPAPTVALGFVAWLYLVTGINHLDGVADLADAAVVHGDAERRTAVMKDTAIGVGGVLGVVVVVVGLALAGLGLASQPPAAIPLVVAAEVGAKAGMGVIACAGSAAHDGLGAALTGESGLSAAGAVLVLALPAAAFSWPHPAAAATLVTALATAGVVLVAARRLLDGVSGDVFGASNELARLVGLHAGVTVWLV